MRHLSFRNPVALAAALSLMLAGANPAPSLAASPRNVWVNSFEDFMIHTWSHIERVQALGLRLVAIDPALNLALKGWEPELAQFLALHDQSKINNSPAFVRLHHLEGKTELGRRLYSDYGKAIDPLTPVIAELNDVDNSVARAFRSAHPNIPYHVWTLFLKVEKVADGVDRGLAPQTSEEMNKKVLPASQFLEPGSEERRLARRLESQYADAVKGLTFAEIRSRLRVGPTPYGYATFARHFREAVTQNTPPCFGEWLMPIFSPF